MAISRARLANDDIAIAKNAMETMATSSDTGLPCSVICVGRYLFYAAWNSQRIPADLAEVKRSVECSRLCSCDTFLDGFDRHRRRQDFATEPIAAQLTAWLVLCLPDQIEYGPRDPRFGHFASVRATLSSLWTPVSKPGWHPS